MANVIQGSMTAACRGWLAIFVDQDKEKTSLPVACWVLTKPGPEVNEYTLAGVVPYRGALKVALDVDDLGEFKEYLFNPACVPSPRRSP